MSGRDGVVVVVAKVVVVITAVVLMVAPRWLWVAVLRATVVTGRMVAMMGWW